jgi:dTDP-4-dehydrorhamnose 3,5-epimerase
MIFEPLFLPGAFRIRPERHEDHRGYFARTFCAREFIEQGINPTLVQCNASFNRLRGTLRGMHWQAEPHGEDKLVRVTRGAVWDVLVDLRPDSPAYLRWHGEILDEDNGCMLYIPRGFAHGFVALRDEMSAYFDSAAARGARFDDPAFGIRWPISENLIVSERDLAFPAFNPVKSA